MKPRRNLTLPSDRSKRLPALHALLTGIALATTIAVLTAVPATAAQGSTNEPAPLCPPGGALVTYSKGGFWGGKTLVIRRDGRAWLCWAQVRQLHGRAGFILTHTEMTALRRDLSQIRVRNLGPPPPRPCVECDEPITEVSYRATTLPWSGSQATEAAAGALRRVEQLLDRLAEQHIRGA